jgi:hypothetical protein
VAGVGLLKILRSALPMHESTPTFASIIGIDFGVLALA